jgi:IPT/TIG domain
MGAYLVIGCGAGGPSSTTSPAPVVSMVYPTSGPTVGGTLVTIYGANFQTGATVQFASVPASGVTFNGSTNLTVMTPAGPAGAADVKVTNPDGQSSALPQAFVYVGSSNCIVPTTIDSDTTLDPSCVWTVTNTVVVGGPSSPVLTISPGTQIQFIAQPVGAFTLALQVGVQEPGVLVANGTGTAPIVFTSASASPDAGDWGGIVIGPQSGGTAINNARIEYAGGPGANDIQDQAAVTLEGGDLLGGSQSPTPLLSNLTVSNSAGHGLVFAGQTTGFGPNSANISIANWEQSAHYPLVIEANEGGTIPITIFARPVSSPTAAVAFNSYVNITSDVITSTTWPAIPLPYVALTTINVTTLNSSSASTTLSIAAPNTIAFTAISELDVDPYVNGNAFLQANGTVSDSIIFTSNQANPTDGAWGGINFWCSGDDQFMNSSLTYASIKWATSPNQANNDTGEVAILNETSSPNTIQGPVIAHCSFGNYTDYGIAMVDISNSSYNSYIAPSNSFATSKNVVLYCTGLITGGGCTPEP